MRKSESPEGFRFAGRRGYLCFVADLPEADIRNLDTSDSCILFFVKTDNYLKYFRAFAKSLFLKSRESLEPTSEMEAQGNGFFLSMYGNHCLDQGILYIHLRSQVPLL